jgi:hypothetical protein
MIPIGQLTAGIVRRILADADARYSRPTAIILQFPRKATMTNPQPVQPLPWLPNPQRGPGVFDANGDVVSLVRNAEWLIWLANREHNLGEGK